MRQEVSTNMEAIDMTLLRNMPKNANFMKYNKLYLRREGAGLFV